MNTPSDSTYPCLVGLFDILGFSAFVQHNSIQTVASTIRDCLKLVFVMPQYAQMQASVLYTSEILQRLPVEKIVGTSSIETLVFSDTILFLERIVPEGLGFEGTVQTHSFLRACNALLLEMFFAGLPIRGALSAGEVFREGTIFAGKPIVEAHREEREIKWSGGIVTASFLKHINSLRNPTFLQQQLTQFPIRPYEACSVVLNWPYWNLKERARISGDAREAVESAFSKHGKSTEAQDVKEKVKNTAAFLEYSMSLVKPRLPDGERSEAPVTP